MTISFFCRYQMAENMDTQLKQMSEDLKEIIEHLNETNRTQDISDPVSYSMHLFVGVICSLFHASLSTFICIHSALYYPPFLCTYSFVSLLLKDSYYHPCVGHVCTSVLIFTYFYCNVAIVRCYLTSWFQIFPHSFLAVPYKLHIII